MHAAVCGYVDITKLSKENGASIKAADDKNMTALLNAPSSGHIDGRANIEAVGSNQFTALMCAVEKDCADMPSLLLKKRTRRGC